MAARSKPTSAPLLPPLLQGGRQFSAGDFLRRLQSRFCVEDDVRVLADDPEAFNWWVLTLSWVLALGLVGLRCPSAGDASAAPQPSRPPPCPALLRAVRRSGLGQLPAVARVFATPPDVHHMLGPLDAQPRQKRAVQRQAKRRAPVGEHSMARAGTGGPAAACCCCSAHWPGLTRPPRWRRPNPCAGPAERPEEVESLEDQEKQETDRNMEEMWRVLTDAGGRCGRRPGRRPPRRLRRSWRGAAARLACPKPPTSCLHPSQLLLASGAPAAGCRCSTW